MLELSMHILDIVQNAIAAGADLIEIRIVIDTAKNTLTIDIIDNGRGMSEEMVKSVTDPFVTGRTTRKVGLGIPLFEESARQTGGDFEIISKIGEGTEVKAWYVLDHIDRAPMGDLASTMLGLTVTNPEVNFVLNYRKDGDEFTYDTAQIKATLGSEVPLQTPEVIAWITQYLNEAIQEIHGGA